MPKTEVILTHNIVGLGAESDQVKVASGYARNYLIPHGLAIPLTGANKRRLEVLRQRRAEREAHELNSMTELAKSISKLICLISVKTGEDGKMFGTVTSGMIADQLKAQFDVALDKKKIHLETPIRTLGDHEIELRLHQDVAGTLKVRVESSTPLPPPPTETPDQGKDQKGERRGRRGDETAAKTEPGKGAPRSEGADKRPRPAKAPEKAAKTDRPAKAKSE